MPNVIISEFTYHGSTYVLKDAVARAAIESLNSFEYVVCTSASDTPYGVIWDDITGILVASANTKNIIYLVPSINAEKDVYDEYITIQNGNEFTWEKIGNTDVDLSGYVVKDNAVVTSSLSMGRLDGSTVGANSTALGQNLVASGANSHAEGVGLNETHTIIANGNPVTNVGYGALGSNSHAEGYATTAYGMDSHAEGYRTDATGSRAHAEGIMSVATAPNAHAEGSASKAYGESSHAEGVNSIANAKGAHAEGYFVSVDGEYSHAEGYKTEANGNNSHAEGNDTHAYGNNSHAEGAATTVIGNNSHGEGSSLLVTGQNAHAEGLGGRFSGSHLYAEKDSYTCSFTNMSFSAAHTVGKTLFLGENYYAKIVEADAENKVLTLDKPFDNDYSNVSYYIFFSDASGNYSHTEGYTTNASGNGAHAEGHFTTASGNSAHSEGSYSNASGNISHAEGAYTVASGYGTHAEGYQTSASNPYAHVEGYQSIASGYGAHAEGFKTTSSSNYSHAEGNQTTASGANGAHAEGRNTIASGSSAHAEGYYTTASGYAAHSEGAYTEAIGAYAHATGNRTIANAYSETAVGLYNVSDTLYPAWEANHQYEVGDKVVISNGGGRICKEANNDAEYDSSKWDNINTTTEEGTLFVVGNGEDSEHRSNAFRVNNQGDARIAGDVYINCNSDSTGGTKLGESDALIKNPVYGTSVTLVDTTTLSFSKDGDNNWYCSVNDPLQDLWSNDFESNYIYRITWDGTDYDEFCATYRTNPTIVTNTYYNWKAIGKVNFLGSYTAYQSSAPFAITVGYRDTNVVKIFANDTEASHTIKIVKIPYSIESPKPKYFYEELLTSSRPMIAKGTGGVIIGGQAADATYGGTVAEGISTLASAIAAHAMGLRTVASGQCSLAGGNESNAAGQGSLAFGLNNIASGTASMAFGGYSASSGNESFASGNHTTASAFATNAAGDHTIAAGYCSSSRGMYNVADSYANFPEWQANHEYASGDLMKRTIDTVVTPYRCTTANNDATFDPSHWTSWNKQMVYAEIVGNGSADNARSNAYALGWDGSGHFKGDIYVNCNSDSSGGTKLSPGTEVVRLI